MMNWKRYITLAISVIFLVPFEQWVHACAGGDDPYDYFPSYFFRDINKNAAYSPFYYTSLLVYADDNYTQDVNIDEWYAYTSSKVPKQDIDSFVYNYSLADLNAALSSIITTGNSKARKEVVDNKFAQWLVKEKDKEAAGYLLFAKQCEPYAQPEDGYYDQKTYEWKTVPRDTVKMADLLAEGRIRHDAAKKEAIQWRYKYQLVRLAFYARKYDEALSLYNTLVGSKTYNGIMCPRCLELKAGILYKTGRKNEAAYLYSKTFDLSDELKQSSHISFSWAVNGKIDDVLKLCRNEHEKAIVYIMKGLHDYGDGTTIGLDMMQKAYDADANIKGLTEVMTREISKAEERFVTKPNIWYYSDSQAHALKSVYPAYLEKLNDFARRVVKDGKNGDKAFWFLAAAYIYLIQNNYAEATAYLGKAAKENMTPRQKDIHGVTTALLILKQNRQLDQATESKLLPALKWIDEKTENDPYFAGAYTHFINVLMTDKYLQQGDTVKAVYTMNGWASWELLDDMSTNQLEHVKAFIRKKDKTPYEVWLTRNSNYQESMLYEMQGTKHLRAQEYDKAIAAFKKVPDSAINAYLLPDCFVSHIQDMQDWNRSDSAVMYNKLTLAQKLAAMKKKLDANPQDASTAYSYANAMYNLTYYGKGWQAVQYNRSGVEFEAYYMSDERKKAPASKRNYYDASLAEKYYMQAFSNSNDAEFKARCIFMAAKCWQKNCPAPKGVNYYSYDDKLYYSNALKNPYFKQLKQYNKTKFYANAVSTCGYLKDYVRK